MLLLFKKVLFTDNVRPLLDNLVVMSDAADLELLDFSQLRHANILC